MAVDLLSDEISDLCIGKAALRSFPVSITIGEALSALKRSSEGFLSVWSCDHHLSFSGTTALGVGGDKDGECWCVGKITMADIICFLCKKENIRKPSIALQSPVSRIIQKVPEIVKHLKPCTSLLEAVNCILEGAQNLIVPIKTTTYTKQKLFLTPSFGSSTHHNGREFCWLTQEDVARYFFNSIHLFSPIPKSSLDSLNIIDPDILAFHHDEPALSALPAIQIALTTETAVAVTDEDGKLIGEISPEALNHCDETVAAAIATLSISDLMAYMDCVGQPDDLILLVKERLEEKKLTGLLELLDEDYVSSFSSSPSRNSSSSDEEFSIGTRDIRLGGNFGRLVRKSTEAIVCYPKSSFAAVMVQALAHRVKYAWVVEADRTVVGIVTFANLLKVFRDSTSL